MARAKPVSDHVTVRVLGASEITVGTRRIGMSTEALFALALYLTTRAGDRVPREEVLETFWPGGEEEPRRHALRQMLYRLRQKGFAFDEDGDCLRLDPAKVESDLRACLSPTWPESATASGIEAALNVGPTFSARQPAAFLEWFDGLRDEVSHQARRAAMHMIAAARSQGRWADLDRWGRAVLATDPLHEEATLARAEAAAMTGAKTLALEILDGYLAELGEVDASVGKPAQVLRKRIAERRASWLPAGPREVALIGREEEMSVLTQAVESALLGKSRSVLLVGPSGYGKSRLLAEAREYAALRGVRCVAVRAEAIAALHPLALVRELARALSSRPGAAGTDPKEMERVRALIREDVLPASLSFGPATTLDAIKSCLLSLTAAVTEEAPLLITVDDAHLCDELSADVIGELLLGLQNARCTCICAGQVGAASRATQQGANLSIRNVVLLPLSSDSCRSLAQATALAHNREISADLLAYIARRSGGHPLFARELALSPIREHTATDLPASLADLVAKSLAAQSTEALKVLRAIALLADSATSSRVRMICGSDPAKFTSTVESLARDGLVQLDQNRALVLHDCWRDAILASMPEATRASLALECAETLADTATGPTENVHFLIAQLFSAAGETDRATRHLLQSIDGLLSAGLYDLALNTVRSLSRGLATTSDARLRAREALCLLGTGAPAGALALASSVWRSRILQSADLANEHVLAVCVAADCHIRLDRADSGPAAELLGIARNEDIPPEDRVRACLWGIRMVSNSDRVGRFVEFFEISNALSSILPSSPHAALVGLIFAAEAGTAEDIASAHQRVSQVDFSGLSIWDRCLLLRCCAHAHRIAGSLAEAVETASAAYELAVAHDSDYAARLASELLCNTMLDYDRIREAELWFDRLSSTPDASIASTKSAIGHTRDRLDYARGNLVALAGRVADRLTIISDIGNTHGRASELALAAVVLAQSGNPHDALPLLQSAMSAAARFIGRQAADFAVEMCLAAAATCAADDAATTLARQHIKLRAIDRGLNIATAFKHLRELA